MTVFIFYTKDTSGSIVNTYTKICVKPNRTKLNRILNNKLDRGEIDAFGWCVASEFNYNI